MKKRYSKPEIQFENFCLTTNIAAGCNEIANAMPGQCGVEFIEGGAMNIFLESVTGCTIKIEDGSGEFNEICYYNPTPGNGVFTS